jgi:hypothetical protein
LGVEGPKDGEIKEKVERGQVKSGSQTTRNQCIRDLGRNVIGVHERNAIRHGTSSTYIQTSKETLTQSRGAWRAGRLQWGSVAGPSCQNEVIAARERRDGVVSGILGGFLRSPCRAGLLEIRIVQRLIALTSVEEHVGIDTLCNGAGTLAKLGLVEASQSTLAKVL